MSIFSRSAQRLSRHTTGLLVNTLYTTTITMSNAAQECEYSYPAMKGDTPGWVEYFTKGLEQDKAAQSQLFNDFGYMCLVLY